MVHLLKIYFQNRARYVLDLKKEINKLKNEVENYNEDEYKQLTRNLNENYKQHLLDKHTINELPINRIRECIEEQKLKLI